MMMPAQMPAYNLMYVLTRSVGPTSNAAFAATFPTLVTPANFVFLIWPVIAVLQLATVTWSALRPGRPSLAQPDLSALTVANVGDSRAVLGRSRVGAPRVVTCSFFVNNMKKVDAIEGTVELDFQLYAQWVDPALAGVPIARQPEQDRHDFEKCLTWLRQRQGDAAPRLSVVAMGAFGGRLDQQMANINMLYRYAGAFERLVLLGDESLAFLLPAGKHVIEPNPEVEEGTCGLIPLGGRCTRVRTSGLRWNLSDAPLEFGSLVSSSNKFVDARVTVETSSPLLWTTSLHRAAVKHARL